MVPFGLVAIAILVLPLVAMVLLPVKLARAFLGLTWFGLGILWLGFATSTFLPYDDDSPGDAFAPLILAVVVSVGVFMILLLAARDRTLFLLEYEHGRRHLDWMQALPLGALAGVIFMHWLRNRLAGTEPAAFIHAAVIGAFLASLLLAGLSIWKRYRWLRLVDRALLAFAAMGIVLACANIQMGFQIWNQSRELAAGRRFCAMTYGGFEKQRQARSGWDLSPLVNRRYATWAVSKAPVVFIEQDGKIQSFRYFAGLWRDVTSWGDGSVRRCTPA